MGVGGLVVAGPLLVTREPEGKRGLGYPAPLRPCPPLFMPPVGQLPALGLRCLNPGNQKARLGTLGACWYLGTQAWQRPSLLRVPPASGPGGFPSMVPQQAASISLQPPTSLPALLPLKSLGCGPLPPTLHPVPGVLPQPPHLIPACT